MIPWRAKAWLARRRPARPAILMYHRVCEPASDPWGLAVSPGNFASQLEWLARERRVIPLRDFVEAHAKGALAPDSLAITFDDGYVDNGQVAAPLLRQAGLPATLFVTSGTIGRSAGFWWDRLARAILETTHAIDVSLEWPSGKSERLCLPASAPADQAWRAWDPPASPRQIAFMGLWQGLHALSPDDCETVTSQLTAACGVSDISASDRTMDRTELASLCDDGVFALGAHGVTHRSLPLASPTDLRDEISRSVAILSEITQGELAGFAYPYGDHSPETFAMLSDLGVGWACTTRHAVVRGRDNPLALPRITVPDGDGRMLATTLGFAP